MLAFIRGAKNRIYSHGTYILSKLLHFCSVDYFEGAAVSQSSRRFKKEIEGDKRKGKVLKRIRKILLNVDPYEIGIFGIVILWTANEKKGMYEIWCQATVIRFIFPTDSPIEAICFSTKVLSSIISLVSLS
jgi:hypothetical protein